MRVAGIEATGGPVKLIEVPDPRPLAADEVLIDVRAAHVGNWDRIVAEGNWDVGRTAPMALGVAAAGVIAYADAGSGWAAGDEVLTHPLPLRDQGTWAPQLIAPGALLARKPTGLAWEIAAALPVPALTAIQALDEAIGLKAGETLLVHGAGGVTGRLLTALGHDRGAQVIATASPGNHAELVALGADHVLDYHDVRWATQAASLAGGGVDAAVNAVRDGSATAIRTVRDQGRLATVVSDPPEAQRGIEISEVYVRADGPQLQQTADLCAEGRLPVKVWETFALDDAAAALETAVQGTGGRAVVIEL